MVFFSDIWPHEWRFISKLNFPHPLFWIFISLRSVEYVILPIFIFYFTWMVQVEPSVKLLMKLKKSYRKYFSSENFLYFSALHIHCYNYLICTQNFFANQVSMSNKLAICYYHRVSHDFIFERKNYFVSISSKVPESPKVSNIAEFFWRKTFGDIGPPL